MPFLDRIHSPRDLRGLSRADLRKVVDEVRDRHIDVVSRKGGHFGASLGVAELTVALHYVFDTPRDQIVWDTGHQAYIHKILTGRNEELPTIRTKGGLAPFLRRDESEFDTFGAGVAVDGNHRRVIGLPCRLLSAGFAFRRRASTAAPTPHRRRGRLSSWRRHRASRKRSSAGRSRWSSCRRESGPSDGPLARGVPL